MTKMKTEIDEPWTKEEIAERFPDVDPGVKAFGSRVILQIRSPKKRTRGGIVLPDDIGDTELFLTQTGRVRALGPVAFRNRDTLEPWPEGPWVEVGMFVRMPKFNQDKWWVEYEVPVKEGQPVKNKALFMIVNDLTLLGERTGNPFAISGYIQ